MAEKTVNVICKIMIVLFAGCSLILLFCLLFGKVTDHSRLLSRIGTAGTLFMTLMAAILLLVLIITAFRQIELMKERSLKIFAAILFVAIFAVFAIMLGNFRVIPITDSHAMLDQSKYLADNPGAVVDETSPHHVYFAKYSNNYFLTICFMYFFRFLNRVGVNDVYFPLYLLNASFLYVGVVFAYLAAKEAGGYKTAVRTLMLLALNPVFYVLTFWIYSCTLSIPLMTAIVWLGIKVYKSKKLVCTVLYSALASVLGALSYFIRPTSLIPFIALIVLAVLLCIKHRKNTVRVAVSAAVCLIVFWLLFTVINQSTKAYFGAISDGNYPITHWLMMSSHGNGTYNGADDQFTASFDTKEEKQKANIEKIKENYKKLGISGTLVLYIKKMCITFADGWSECDIRLAQDTRFTAAYRFLAGDQRDLFEIYCDAFRMITLLLMLAAAVVSLRQKHVSPFLILYILTMLGGIAFYFLWEAKATYGVPFIPIMLLIAETGGCALSEQAEKIMRKCSKKTYLHVGAVAGCIWVFAGIVFYHDFCVTEFAHTEYSVRGYSLQLSGYVSGVGHNGNTLMQSFYADRPFNRIDIYADLSSESTESAAEYQIEILDCQQNVLFQTTASANEVKNNKLTVSFERIGILQEEQYYLMITRLSEHNPALKFRHRHSVKLDQYNGTLWVNGEPANYDLLMSVYDSYKAPYMSRWLCALIYLIGTACAAGLYLYMFRCFEKEKAVWSLSS